MTDRVRTYRPGFFARLLPQGKWKVRLNVSLPAAVQLDVNGALDLPCLDVIAISVTKALLWHSVEVRSRKGIHTLSCLGEEAATRLAANLYSFINSHLFDLISFDTDRLSEVDTKLQTITEGNRQYLAHADLARAIAGVTGEAAAALSHPLFDPELMPATLKAVLPRSLAFVTDPDVRHRYNDAFVSAELSRYRSFFDNLDGRSLSDQQREACIRLEDNNLLVASAGSGKSATMVGKVAYVLDKQLYRPEEILVLAFNKSAADELKKRISRQLAVDPGNSECKVTTFHALGRGIIEEVEGRTHSSPTGSNTLPAKRKSSNRSLTICCDQMRNSPISGSTSSSFIPRRISRSRCLVLRLTTSAICRCAGGKAMRPSARWPGYM